MIRYEYEYDSRTYCGNQLYGTMTEDLNMMGKEGWRVVSILEKPWAPHSGLHMATVFFERAYIFDDQDLL